MTKTTLTNCPCGEPADGLDDIHCQECWEQLCSDLWWQEVGAIEMMEAMEMIEMEIMEGDRND